MFLHLSPASITYLVKCHCVNSQVRPLGSPINIPWDNTAVCPLCNSLFCCVGKNKPKGSWESRLLKFSSFLTLEKWNSFEMWGCSSESCVSCKRCSHGLCPFVPPDSLPYSIRVLFESSVRHCDGFLVKETDAMNILDWKTKQNHVEVPFCPARVVLQDFT